MKDVFNAYSLTDDEFLKILEDNEIRKFLEIESARAKTLKEDCKQHIIISLYKTLTKND